SLSCNGQVQFDCGAHAWGAANVEQTAMAFDDVLHDGEPETRSPRLAAARRINPVEALGEPWQVFTGNAWPVVGHRYRNRGATLFREYVDRRTRFAAAIAESVADEIVEHLNELSAVAAHGR